MRPSAELLAVRYQQIGDVRAWAAHGLGELGDRSVLPKLVKATEDPDDFFLRYMAAGALGQVAGAASAAGVSEAARRPRVRGPNGGRGGGRRGR